jgi:hypothetical protein
MAGFYSHTTRAAGLTLTANIYNTDHQNHIDNMDPEMMDDYSPDAATMRAQTDPGEQGSESLAGTLAAELERLRFALKDISGKTYWYETPTRTLEAINTESSANVFNGNNIVLTARIFD